MRPWVAGLGLIFFAGGGLADPAHARSESIDRIKAMVPLEKVIERAKAKQPGRMIEAEVDDHHGKLVYEIEILDDSGRVWELLFDAKSGDLIRRSAEDPE